MTELQRYGFRGPFPKSLCAEPGWLVEKSNSDPAIAATLFDNVGPETLLSRRFADLTLRTYRLRPVTGLRVAALCPAR